MNKIPCRIFMMLLVLLPVLALVACGGGGGGITGTGVVTGTVTGFGSVIVNGIEFTRRGGLPDERVNFAFDDSLHAERDLRVGMIITVRGAFDSSIGKGEYETIEYHPEVTGPIDAIPGSVDTVNRTVSVLGRTVKVDVATIFDGFGDLADLQPGNLVEVSGNLDSSGAFLATRVERKAASFAPGGLVELKGAVSAVGAGTLNIGTQVVSFDPALPGLFVDMTAAELTVAMLVEVRGTLGADGVIRADRIEKKLAAGLAQANDTFRVKGSVLTVTPTTAQLAGPNGPLTVLTGNAVFIKGTSANLVAGAKVEVEGVLVDDGFLAAAKISFDRVNVIKLEGNVAQAADVDPANGTIRLIGVTLSTDSLTRFRDNRTEPSGPSPTFDLNEIAAQDHLQIVGFVDPAGRAVATQLQRFNADSRTFIQGRVGAAATPNLTILNITVTTSAAATSFVDQFGTPLSQAIFFAALTPDSTVVKASGPFVPPATIALATKVEIEQ